MPACPKKVGNEISRLLYWCYERLYSELAWGYDWVSRLASGGYWQEWTFAAEGFLTTGPIPSPTLHPILDLGCGTGHLVIRLTMKGYRVYGLDRSPQMLQAATKRFGQDGLNVRLVQGMAQTLPFPDSALAAVITTFPAPFVYDRAVRQEIIRVLRPGGRWIWVDAPFTPRQSLRMRIYAVVSNLAQLKGSVFRYNMESSRFKLKDAFRSSVKIFKWHPPIAHAPELSLTVHRVAVKETIVHAAVMEKKNPAPL
jgi:ubiquinone/menaquinone biosynthesis C-methylase UbiE